MISIRGQTSNSGSTPSSSTGGQQQMQGSSSANSGGTVSSSSASSGQPSSGGRQYDGDLDKVLQWINDVCVSSKRESALLELSKVREDVPEMAVYLWHSTGTVAVLMQEVIHAYPYIIPPTLTARQSNRVCNALALLQCIAACHETRHLLLEAAIPIWIYPFLNTSSKVRSFEYLRLTTLGVIGALVKSDEREVIQFLLNTEIMPLCLSIMESGSELSKTVATFILQKILFDSTGLNYVCQTYERFSHVASILGKLVLSLVKEPTVRLLRHVIRCYVRLSDHQRAREALQQCLPDQLKDRTFAEQLCQDRVMRESLDMLLRNLNVTPVNLPPPSSIGAEGGTGGGGSSTSGGGSFN